MHLLKCTLLASQIKGKVDYIYDLTLAVDNINGQKVNLIVKLTVKSSDSKHGLTNSPKKTRLY